MGDLRSDDRIEHSTDLRQNDFADRAQMLEAGQKMCRDELLGLIQRWPFRPFRISISDQRFYDVLSPQQLVVTLSAAIIGMLSEDFYRPRKHRDGSAEKGATQTNPFSPSSTKTETQATPTECDAGDRESSEPASDHLADSNGDDTTLHSSVNAAFPLADYPLMDRFVVVDLLHITRVEELVDLNS